MITRILKPTQTKCKHTPCGGKVTSGETDTMKLWLMEPKQRVPLQRLCDSQAFCPPKSTPPSVQRTGFLGALPVLSDSETKDEGSKLLELRTLERLGEDVGEVVVSGHLLKVYDLFFHHCLS